MYLLGLREIQIGVDGFMARTALLDRLTQGLRIYSPLD